MWGEAISIDVLLHWLRSENETFGRGVVDGFNELCFDTDMDDEDDMWFLMSVVATLALRGTHIPFSMLRTLWWYSFENYYAGLSDALGHKLCEPVAINSLLGVVIVRMKDRGLGDLTARMNACIWLGNEEKLRSRAPTQRTALRRNCERGATLEYPDVPWDVFGYNLVPKEDNKSFTLMFHTQQDVRAPFTHYSVDVTRTQVSEVGRVYEFEGGQGLMSAIVLPLQCCWAVRPVDDFEGYRTEDFTFITVAPQLHVPSQYDRAGQSGWALAMAELKETDPYHHQCVTRVLAKPRIPRVALPITEAYVFVPEPPPVHGTHEARYQCGEVDMGCRYHCDDIDCPHPTFPI
jgi:hypothetical protein